MSFSTTLKTPAGVSRPVVPVDSAGIRLCRPSSFEPNQAELYVSRSVPNQPGFVIDLNFLNTAEVMHGLTTYYGDQLGSHNPTGWMDPTQVYLTYTVPVGSGINLSAGHQVSLIGYEYIPSWNNINFNQ